MAASAWPSWHGIDVLSPARSSAEGWPAAPACPSRPTAMVRASADPLSPRTTRLCRRPGPPPAALLAPRSHRGARAIQSYHFLSLSSPSTLYSCLPHSLRFLSSLSPASCSPLSAINSAGRLAVALHYPPHYLFVLPPFSYHMTRPGLPRLPRAAPPRAALPGLPGDHLATQDAPPGVERALLARPRSLAVAPLSAAPFPPRSAAASNHPVAVASASDPLLQLCPPPFLHSLALSAFRASRCYHPPWRPPSSAPAPSS